IKDEETFLDDSRLDVSSLGLLALAIKLQNRKEVELSDLWNSTSDSLDMIKTLLNRLEYFGYAEKIESTEGAEYSPARWKFNIKSKNNELVKVAKIAS
ncbi:hypothetical protein, partial [Leptospira ellisii]